MDSTKNNSWLPASCLVLACLLPTAGLGAEVGGGIRVGASYTDNVFLDTAPVIDEVIFQASPFMNLVHESPNWDANVNYAFNWYRYADLKTTSRYHRGEATLTGKAWEESLAVQLGVRRSQVLNDPEGVIPTGRLPLSGNLDDEDEWWVNPRFNRTLGNDVQFHANYVFTKIQYDNSLLQENTSQEGDFSLDNYAAGQGMTWALHYDWLRAEYDVSTPWENQRATAELGFWVNSKARVFGAGGKESSWDNPFDPAMDDSFWEAGFAYSPSEKLSAEFAAGERSFGSSWRGRLDYTFRRGSTSLSYDESPTTTGFDRIGGTRRFLDADDLDDYLTRPGSAESYISKRFTWNIKLEYRRTGFNLSVFDEDRSDRFSADGTPRPDQSQTGVRADISRQVGVRTNLVASGTIVDREYGVANKARFVDGELSVSYRLGVHSDLSLGYRYGEQQPRDQSAGGRDYVINIVSLNFTYTM